MRKITFEEAIKALEKGKKVYFNGDGDYIMLNELNIPISYRDSGSIICWNASIGCSCGRTFYLPDEPEEFKIDETGCYKTRNERKVFVSHVGKKLINGVIEGDCSITKWFTNGKLHHPLNNLQDIISKWED